MTNRDFKEVKPGLWLPFEQTVLHYAKIKSEDTSLWGKVTSRCVNKVQSIDFNGQFDQYFDVRLPPGTVVNDFARDIKYTVAEKDADPFSVSIPAARSILGPKKKSQRIWWLVGGNIVLILVVAWVWARRVRPNRAGAGVLLLALVGTIQTHANAESPDGAARRALRDADPALQADKSRNAIDASGSQWLWKPSWTRGDCGPNALFVLLKLTGKNVLLEEIKERVSFDPTLGCSIADLCEAANVLDLLCEVRFVTPKDLWKIPPPYILHGQSRLRDRTGHFLVVVGRGVIGSEASKPVAPLAFRRSGVPVAPESFASIDGTIDQLGWRTERAVLSNYSGYILVPKYTQPPSYEELGCLAIMLGLIGCVAGVKSRASEALRTHARTAGTVASCARI